MTAATGLPAAALPQSSGGGGTTTIGTIAVNSGQTKMVIALLRCDSGGGDGADGAKLAIKVLELEPGLAHLGGSLEEAAELLRAHDLVIESLQSKQTPVEELLRQADDLIANQRPRAEVYTAMAESLGHAWKDLNDHLDQRKEVLKLNFNFQGHFEVSALFSGQSTGPKIITSHGLRDPISPNPWEVIISGQVLLIRRDGVFSCYCRTSTRK